MKPPKTMYRLFPLLLLLSCFQVSFSQQTKGELKLERKERLRKVEEIASILEQTTADRFSSLDQLKAINQQLYQRKELLANVEIEIKNLEEEIKETDAVIRALERDLQGLMDEYKLMIYHSSKSSNSYHKVSYLLSSVSFNQFLSRLGYMEQYHEARKRQIGQIRKVRNLLDQKRQLIVNQKNEKKELIITEKQQGIELVSLRQKKGELIKQLQRREKDLKVQLVEEEKYFKNVADLVVSNVEEGLEAIKEKPVSKEEMFTERKLNKKAVAMASSFEKSKGNLVWPVDEGFVSAKFGIQKHPVFEHLTSENIGVDIRTNKKQPVNAVFDGKVIAVTKVPGKHYLVMVQHGSYFTVYARLQKVNVSVGTEVQQGTLLGTVFTNEKDISELQFQVWRNSSKLDPENWLRK